MVKVMQFFVFFWFLFSGGGEGNKVYYWLGLVSSANDEFIRIIEISSNVQPSQIRK